MLKVHLAQRLHVHILSRAPLRAGDVFQPGRSQAETGLTIGKGPSDRSECDIRMVKVKQKNLRLLQIPEVHRRILPDLKLPQVDGL